MAAALPDARLVVVPAAGHAVHLERPDAFAAALDSFLQERQGALRLA
jgi:pimeloyl-ACP methyl ester carboxylesterase